MSHILALNKSFFLYIYITLQKRFVFVIFPKSIECHLKTCCMSLLTAYQEFAITGKDTSMLIRIRMD
uniref:Uncharacterized protein n=1 Tax=Octopus bimaculoides TaxID=37653 RepID=A0A0L8IBW0_OCTBM